MAERDARVEAYFRGLVPIKTKQGIKAYKTAEGAINAFWKDHPAPEGSITVELVEWDDEKAIFVCEVKVEDKVIARAYGSERAKDFDDYFEKAQTVAIRRALWMAGYTTTGDLEEMYEEGKIRPAVAPQFVPGWQPEEGQKALIPHYEDEERIKKQEKEEGKEQKKEDDPELTLDDVVEKFLKRFGQVAFEVALTRFGYSYVNAPRRRSEWVKIWKWLEEMEKKRKERREGDDRQGRTQMDQGGVQHRRPGEGHTDVGGRDSEGIQGGGGDQEGYTEAGAGPGGDRRGDDARSGGGTERGAEAGDVSKVEGGEREIPGDNGAPGEPEGGAGGGEGEQTGSADGA